VKEIEWNEKDGISPLYPAQVEGNGSVEESTDDRDSQDTV